MGLPRHLRVPSADHGLVVVVVAVHAEGVPVHDLSELRRQDEQLVHKGVERVLIHRPFDEHRQIGPAFVGEDRDRRIVPGRRLSLGGPADPNLFSGAEKFS